MRFAARTDPGRREGENEDSIGADEVHGLWFVADGMGGHGNGRLASQLVRDKMLELAGEESLEAAVLAAHATVIGAAQREPQLEGMGSTIVAARIRDGVCRVVWVGDSRAYLCRNGTLTRLTRDHSLVESLGAELGATDAGADSAPDRRIFQALGRGEPVPSSVPVQLVSGDRILLASDGLHGELDDGEMEVVLASSPDATAAVDALIDAALANGGRDNVSTIVIEVETQDDSQSDIPPSRAERASPWTAVLIGMLMALAASCLWWLFWMR